MCARMGTWHGERESLRDTHSPSAGGRGRGILKIEGEPKQRSVSSEFPARLANTGAF